MQKTLSKPNMILADKGARVGSFIVDCLLIIILLIIQILVLEGFLNLLTDKTEPFFNFYPIVFFFLYYFVFEYFFGKTPGKHLTKTIVVTHLGEKPKIKALAMRSIARLVPYDCFSFLFGQGLHDSISKTVVIKFTK